MRSGSRLNAERVRGGAVAGLVAGAAFAAVMELDLALTGNRLDDFRLLAQLGPLKDHWRISGPVAHVANSALLGAIYATVEPRLTGPGWARGLKFALAENTLLWPLVLLIDRAHPAVASGELATFNRPAAYGWETLRHATYGLVLGVCFERSCRHSATSHD